MTEPNRTRRLRAKNIGQLAGHAAGPKQETTLLHKLVEAMRRADMRPKNPLFDVEIYLQRYADVAASGMPAYEHYRRYGSKEHRNPHAVFDSAYYLQQNPGPRAPSATLLDHYFEYGWREGRSPHLLFDGRYYLRLNPDVKAAGINPLLHYLNVGATEGRNPHPLFDTNFYLDRNPDVAFQQANPLVHYLTHGAREGRSPHPLFDGEYYLRLNPDVTGGNPLVHYLENGATEGRNPHPLFDTNFYLDRNPDVAVLQANPLVHYLTHGAREGRSPHPLFDSEYYLRRNPGVTAAGGNPLLHYLQVGAKEGLDPHPLFDTSYYLDRNQDVVEAGSNPLVHYLRNGAEEGRRPHPLFDTKYYLRQVNALSLAIGNPLRHYLEGGATAGLNPHLLFDTQFYLSQHPDIVPSNRNALVDYVCNPVGSRDTHPTLGSSTCSELLQIALLVEPLCGDSLVELMNLVDAAFYRTTYPDIACGEVNPKAHYVLLGWSEGRDPSPWFSTQGYLDANPDARGTSICPLIHYVLVGSAESRYCGPPALDFIQQADRDRQRALLYEAKLFDPEFYLSENPDVKDAGLDAFQHFTSTGWREGRNPSRSFQLTYYQMANPDAPLDVNPVFHYAASGGFRSKRETHPTLINEVPLSVHPTFHQVPLRIPVTSMSEQELRSSQFPRVGVHVHCYYLDVLPKLLEALRSVPRVDMLFVTHSASERNVEEKIRGLLSLANVEKFEIIAVRNQGRDIAPMLLACGKKLLNFDIVLHVHTKKSVERGGFGSEWLADILNKLLFNKAYVHRILNFFKSDPTLGIIAPWPHWRVMPFMVWGRNTENARKLLRRLEIHSNFPDRDLPLFPASSIFWFRPKALLRLLSGALEWGDFESEPIGDDGSMAHAIERCFSHIAEHDGYVSYFVQPMMYEFCWPEHMAPEISVIIPAYNAIEWISAALQSVMAQVSAATPFEVVVVDNNSSDGTVSLIESMQAVYRNLRLVVESKQGAGAARNAGIRSAQGKFITFLDADDLLTTDALQTLHDGAKIANVDVVTSSLIMFDERGFGPAVPFRFPEQLTIANRMTYSSQQSVWTAILSDFGPCAKLYRRDWLLDNDIWFPETGNFEDNAFVIDVYMTAERIAVISLPLYLYRRYTSRSGRTQSTDRSIASLYDQLAVVEEIIRKYNLTRPGMLQSAVYDSLVSKLANELARFGPDLQRKWRDLHNMHGALMDVVTERFPDLKRITRLRS